MPTMMVTRSGKTNVALVTTESRDGDPLKTLYVPTPRKLNAYRDAEYLVSFNLLRLSEYSARLKMTRSDDLAFDLRFYSRIALSQARRRLRLPIPRRWTWLLGQNYWMPSKDPEAGGADAILAYERYPINASLPVIWLAGPTDIARLRRQGISEKEIKREIDFKWEANARAAITVLSTHSKKKLFDEAVRPSRPTRVIPIFQPIQGIAQERFLEKWSDLTRIKLLFIGRAAIRKGLDLVLDAYAILQARFPGKVSLHVVTTFQDGPVDVPELPYLTREALISHARAIELMTESHYLLMPSLLEEYGFVYVEAMARGVIPLATDSPVQRDLFDGGRAGHLVQRRADDIADAVALGIEDPDSAREMAVRTLNHWRTRHAPEVIADQFAQLASSSLTNTHVNEPVCSGVDGL